MYKYPFRVEYVPKKLPRYHGPRKRMKKYLSLFSKTRKKRISQDEFISYLLINFQNASKYIGKIKFYQIPQRNEYLYCALIWVGNSANLRDILFSDGKKITLETGWYPLVTGSRILRTHQAADKHIREGLRKSANKTRFEQLFDWGVPISIEKAYKGAGNSILLKTSTWNILFDVGKEPKKLLMNKLDKDKKTIVFLSHAHSDHSGALLDIMLDDRFFIIASEMTIDLALNRLAFFNELEKLINKKFFYRVFPARFNSVYNFSQGGSLSFYNTNHYPGSAMILLTFKNNKRVLYTGDFALSKLSGTSNNYLINSKSSFWENAQWYIDVGIFDAATAHLSTLPLSDENTLFKLIDREINQNNIVTIILNSSDIGVYLYLELFLRYNSGVNKKRVPIFVDPILNRHLNTIDKYLKLKRTGSLWGVLNEIYERRLNPCESVWLYSGLENVIDNYNFFKHKKHPQIHLLDYNFSYTDDIIAIIQESSEIIVIGSKIDENEIKVMNSKKLLILREMEIPISTQIKHFLGNYWNSHNTKDDLTYIVDEIGEKFKIIYLFHKNFEDLKKICNQLSPSNQISINPIPEEKSVFV